MMKRSMVLTVLMPVVATTAFAQSPENVEKAVRFRAPQTESVEVRQSESKSGINTVDQKATTTEELGSRYAVSFSNNAVQSEELGSRYAVAWSNNAAQLEELGSRYAVAWSNNAVQLEELGSRYAVAWSN